MFDLTLSRPPRLPNRFHSMLITGCFVIMALQSAVSLSCSSINNEGLSSHNHTDSDCVAAEIQEFFVGRIRLNHTGDFHKSLLTSGPVAASVQLE